MRNAALILPRIVAAFIFIFYGPSLSAQHITISAPTDSISISETLMITLTGEVDEFNDPAVLDVPNGFAHYGDSQEFTYNQRTKKIHITQMFALQPLEPGTYTIGPAKIQSGSRTILSNKITVTVIGKKLILTNTFFLYCMPDKRKAFLGEQVILSLWLMHEKDVKIIPGLDRPFATGFNGCWYSPGQYSPGASISDTSFMLNGKEYEGSLIYNEYIFPNATGKLQVPVYEYICTLMKATISTGNDIIDNLIANPTPVELHTEPVTIEVLPVPEEKKPDDFGGDVGTFSLSASLDQSEVKAGDPVKLSVVITGKGNISFIQLRDPVYPDGIEAHAPFTTDSIHRGRSGISGEKTFTFTLIPKTAGQLTIPGVKFSYYDAAKKDYVTLTTPDFQLDVKPAPASAAQTENNLPEGFLSPKSPVEIMGRFLLILLPPLLVIAALIWWNQKRRRRVKAQPAAQPGEPEAPVKTGSSKVGFLVENASQLLQQQHNIPGAIYIAYEALITACCEKCEIPREEASMSQVRFRLGIKNTEPAFVDEVITMLDRLSSLRYTATPPSAEAAGEIIREVRTLLTRLGF